MRNILFLCIVLFLCSCNRKHKLITDDDILESTLRLPVSPYNYANQLLPDFFSNQFIQIQNNANPLNPITDWGATLGRVLFYDSLLSRNYTISCATCHVQSVGFTDTAQFSTGFEGKQTKRHSMSLLNATYYQSGRFFWDERAATLEDQVLQPIEDSIEMGMSMAELIARINTTTYYPIFLRRHLVISQFRQIQ
jgi:cytochrome c peroxidase